MSGAVAVCCGQKDCVEKAVSRFFWPGSPPKPGCERHIARAREVAAALGFSLQVAPLEDEARLPRGPIAEEWASYLARVVPRDAPPVQVQESRRAFYAGCRTLLTLVVDAGAGEEEIGVALLAALEAELATFSTDVAEGRS